MRVGFLLAVLLGFGLLSEAGASDRIELPAGPNRDLVYAKCRVCHDLQYVVDSAGITPANWKALIEDMGRYGLRIPDEDRKKIVEYLGTYLGPNPPKAEPAAAESAQADVNGREVFLRQCSSCHQKEGEGLPGTFPPLAGNPDLFLAREFPVYVVLNGLEGQITVKGGSYQGVMPPFDHLADDEVAAVVNYVRSSWGNGGLRPDGFADVDAALVKEARARRMGPKDVHAFREAQR